MMFFVPIFRNSLRDSIPDWIGILIVFMCCMVITFIMFLFIRDILFDASKVEYRKQKKWLKSLKEKD